MDDNNSKLQRLAIAMILPTGILLILITDLFSLTHDLNWQSFGELIGYKILLKLLIFLLFAWFTSIFYYRSVIKSFTPKNTESKKNQKKPPQMSKEEFIQKNKSILENLSKDEKEYLRRYIYNNTKTQYFEYSDGVAQGLEASKIIYRSSNLSGKISKSYNPMFSYNIQPWAWEHLNQHPELLD